VDFRSEGDSLPPQVIHGCLFIGVLKVFTITIDQSPLKRSFQEVAIELLRGI
jgi:hypothetical protein